MFQIRKRCSPRLKLRPFGEAMSWWPVDPVFFFASGGSTSGNTHAWNWRQWERLERKKQRMYFLLLLFKGVFVVFLQFPNGEDSWKQYWYTLLLLNIPYGYSFFLNISLQFVRYQSLFEKSNPYSQLSIVFLCISPAGDRFGRWKRRSFLENAGTLPDRWGERG